MNYLPTSHLSRRNDWNRQRKAIIHHSPMAVMFKLLTATVIITLFALVLMIESAHAMAADQTPEQLVKQTTSQMLHALQEEREEVKKNPQRVYALADEIVLPHFDVQRMAAWVLGKHWRKATAIQKQQFPNEFRKLILRTYATAMAEYTDENVVILPARLEPDNTDSLVRTEIRRSTGPAIPVAYRMHKTAGGWKVYDISIDGISLLNNYRRNFSREVRRNGVEGLMKKLSSHNTQVASNH